MTEEGNKQMKYSIYIYIYISNLSINIWIVNWYFVSLGFEALPRFLIKHQIIHTSYMSKK